MVKSFERPHHRDLHLHAGNAQRIHPVVTVQDLVRFARMDLDGGAASHQVLLAVGEQDFVQHCHHGPVADDFGGSPGHVEHRVHPERGVAVEVAFG